jgi:ppGpp synthetase/RelA/SpoT-type nucleotidyltranferase
MIQIKVTLGENSFTKTFEGKNKDKESIKFLEDLYADKMDKACLELFNKRFTQGLITTNNKQKPNGMGYRSNHNYLKLERYDFEKLSVEIQNNNK